ncbi:hypothetical protein PIB30_056007 [Stylosanthes scabra]|uniref:Uncharacterized protein n=1 Tax=Stylosanthes scabra TaxID=79078 RepID=A0ABU6RJ50_9FABA|nr:hypothetical protein [Stylosanthes scabra]
MSWQRLSFDALLPGCRLRTGCDVDGLPLRSAVVLSICGKDMAYHLGKRTHDDPVGVAMRDFHTHYQCPTWGWVEQLGVRPEQNPETSKESFSNKMTLTSAGNIHGALSSSLGHTDLCPALQRALSLSSADASLSS